jgi:dTMP kinase
MAKRGLFIVLEGPDKSGKSTQAALLVKALGRGVVHTREPGGTSFAEAVRKVVLNPAHTVEPMAELLLYEAARAQHTQEKLRPALDAGKTVVSERYTLATLAYQGYARGLSLPLVRGLNKIASFGIKPDLTLVLDIPERQFADRDRHRVHDRLERESAAFRRRVRDGYRRLSRTEKGVTLIDGSRPVEEVHAQILARVKRLRK